MLSTSVNKSLEDVHAFGSRSHLSSIQAAIASSADKYASVASRTA